MKNISTKQRLAVAAFVFRRVCTFFRNKLMSSLVELAFDSSFRQFQEIKLSLISSNDIKVFHLISMKS